MSESDIDHKLTKEPVCPHCGSVVTDACELQMKNDHSDGYQCNDCNMRFDIYRVVDVSYTTYPSD